MRDPSNTDKELHSKSIDLAEIRDMMDIPGGVEITQEMVLRDSFVVEWLEERD